MNAARAAGACNAPSTRSFVAGALHAPIQKRAMHGKASKLMPVPSDLRDG